MIDLYNLNDEIPKLRKKKESTTSKSKDKSKHKHIYVDCLFLDDKNIHKGAYCTICGKIKQFDFRDHLERSENGWQMLSNDEILEKYSELEKISIENYFKQKYIKKPEEDK